MGSHKNPQWRPKTRRGGLVVEPAGDELMVYDLDRHKVHYLNGPAAEIWRLCDGDSTVEEISAQGSAEVDSIVREKLVDAALDELHGLRLLEEDTVRSGARISRRELVRSLGIGAIAAAITLPLITTITAPPAYAAISCKKQGACASPRDCCSNMCVANVCIPSGD